MILRFGFLDMLKKGAIEEAKKYLKMSLQTLHTSNSIIGLKEIKSFLAKKTN